MNNLLFDSEFHQRRSLIRIGIDVDLTLVDTLTLWVNWFNGLYQGRLDFQPITEACYKDFKDDLCKLMCERTPGATGYDPMDFWRQPFLYDKLEPIAGAVDFLKKLRIGLEEFYRRVEFVAVSKCEPEHERSKRRFIQKQFNDVHGLMIDSFISTDEKHLLALDVLIDDSPKYIMPCIGNKILQVYVPQGNYGWPQMSEEFTYMFIDIPQMPGVTHFQQMLEDMPYFVNSINSHVNSFRSRG